MEFNWRKLIDLDIQPWETGHGFEVIDIDEIPKLYKYIYNQAIQDASENAEADIDSMDGELTELLSKLQCGVDYEIPVIRHSILKLKK